MALFASLFSEISLYGFFRDEALQLARVNGERAGHVQRGAIADENAVFGAIRFGRRGIE